MPMVEISQAQLSRLQVDLDNSYKTVAILVNKLGGSVDISEIDVETAYEPATYAPNLKGGITLTTRKDLKL